MLLLLQIELSLPLQLVLEQQVEAFLQADLLGLAPLHLLLHALAFQRFDLRMRTSACINYLTAEKPYVSAAKFL